MRSNTTTANVGQALWLDILLERLEQRTLQALHRRPVGGRVFRPIARSSHAIKNSAAYDALGGELVKGQSVKDCLLELALEDLPRRRHVSADSTIVTQRRDGWVSLGYLLLAHDHGARSPPARSYMHARPEAESPSLIPGTEKEGCPH